MNRRRLLSLLASAPALGAAAIGNAGCSRLRADDGRTTIRYMAWGNPEQIAVERQIIQEFEKRNPHIRVHLFMVPGSSYADKLQLMLASRTAPDVMRADHYYFPALVRKGYFLPLDPLIAAERPGFLEDFAPIAIEEGTWNGKLYGLNVLFGGIMVYYNKDLFAKEGLPDPYDVYKRGEWDWETFVRMAKALTKREGNRYVQFGTNMVVFPQYASVIWNHGGEMMDPDLTRVTMAADPQTVLGVQKYADLRWQHHCSPTPAESDLSAFTLQSGRLAMSWGWAGESPLFRKNIKSFQWDVVPTPSGPRGDRTVVKGNQLTIYRESEHPREAWEFLKFMTGPDAEMLLCANLRRAVPTRLSVQRDPRYLQTDQPPFHTDVFLETVRRGRTLPIDHRYQEWVQQFNSAIETLFNVNEKDAAASLAEASARANTVLAGEEGF
jgi:multiple sugar transport system substrate-binding protein